MCIQGALAVHPRCTDDDMIATDSQLHLPKAELNTNNSTKPRRAVMDFLVEILVFNSIYNKKVFHLTQYTAYNFSWNTFKTASPQFEYHIQ